MSDTPPYSEATVAMLAQVIDDERGCFPEVMAAYVLGALDAAGLLLPEGAERRTTYGVRVGDKVSALRCMPGERPRNRPGRDLVQRDVITIPWSAVPPEPKEGAGGQPSPA